MHSMPGMPSFQLWRLVVGGDPHFPVQSHGELGEAKKKGHDWHHYPVVK